MAMNEEKKTRLHIRAVTSQEVEVTYKKTGMGEVSFVLQKHQHKPTVRRSVVTPVVTARKMEVFAVPKRSSYVIHASDMELFERTHRVPSQIAATRSAASVFVLNNLKKK